MTVPLFAEEPVPVSNRRGGVEDVIEVVGDEVRIQGLVNLTFDAVPAGATLLLDGIAHTAPFVYDTLICGPRRRLLAVRLYGERFEPVTELERAAVDKLCHYRYCHGIRSGGFAVGTN